jgi:predicted PurR-regulated permease PerM
MKNWLSEFHQKRYYLHAIGYVIIIRWKSITDNLNEPIKMDVGHWTNWVYALEGEFTKVIQDAFLNDTLTTILNFHYLFIYLFLIYVTTVYFAYSGDRDMTDKVTMNYLLIYALAVPYYLFFNVEVTSSWIPGMDALLYQDGAYTTFYALHDPLDNAVPSLHVAIPFGILVLNYLHVKEKGGKMSEWEHWPYHLFVLINTILFCFSILYLGIHWFTDIPLGMIIGGIGALFIHHLQPRLRNDHGSFFKGFTKLKVRRHALIEGIGTLFMLAIILMAVNFQIDQSDERVSYQLGPQDSTFEIIQEINFGDTVDSQITNLDSELTLEVVYLQVEQSVEAMSNGLIDWDTMKTLGLNYTVLPGDTLDIETTQNEVYHFIVLHNPAAESSSDSLLKVRVMNDYHEEAKLSAILLSLPSLWMTVFVLHRLQRLNINKRSLIDSSPSHIWEEEE